MYFLCSDPFSDFLFMSLATFKGVFSVYNAIDFPKLDILLCFSLCPKALPGCKCQKTEILINSNHRHNPSA